VTKGRQVDRPEEQRIAVNSGYGANTRQPFVELYLGTRMVQLTPLKAREIAKYLLEAAEAAEGDGFLVEYISKLGELPTEQAAGVLVEFRQFREQQREKQQRWEYPEVSSG
jgi:hypothetical protein